MKPKLLDSLLYNKLLEENKLIGITYYPSKRGGFQFLLIIKSGIKVDFIKYNFVSYKKLFNISNEDDILIEEKKNIINNLNKIYIPIKNIKGYSYEETNLGFNTYLKIKDNNDKIVNILISKVKSQKLNLKDDSIIYNDILKCEGFTLKNQECKEHENNMFKKLKLGINDTTSSLFYI